MSDPIAGITSGVGGLLDSIGKGAGAIWDMFTQGKTWQREDTAVQRRVADLKAAGLSPVLAAGSAAQTSNPVHIGQSDFGIGAQDAASKVMEMMKMKQDVAQSSAATALYGAQRANVLFNNDKVIQDTLSSKANQEFTKTQNEMLRGQLNWDHAHGVRPGTNNGPVKDVMDAIGAAFGGRTPLGVIDQAFTNGGAFLDQFGKAPPPKVPGIDYPQPESVPSAGNRYGDKPYKTVVPNPNAYGYRSR